MKDQRELEHLKQKNKMYNNTAFSQSYNKHMQHKSYLNPLYIYSLLVPPPYVTTNSYGANIIPPREDFHLVIVLKTRKKRRDEPYNDQLDLFQDAAEPAAPVCFSLRPLLVLIARCCPWFLVLRSLVRVCRVYNTR